MLDLLKITSVLRQNYSPKTSAVMQESGWDVISENSKTLAVPTHMFALSLDISKMTMNLYNRHSGRHIYITGHGAGVSAGIGLNPFPVYSGNVPRLALHPSDRDILGKFALGPGAKNHTSPSIFDGWCLFLSASSGFGAQAGYSWVCFSKPGKMFTGLDTEISTRIFTDSITAYGYVAGVDWGIDIGAGGSAILYRTFPIQSARARNSMHPKSRLMW